MLRSAVTPLFSRAASRCGAFMAMSTAPAADELKPFYALGVNVAGQIGGQIKPVMSKEELHAIAAGFNASMLENVDTESVSEFLPEVNTILSQRMSALAAEKSGDEKAAGIQFRAEYLATNPSAVKTDSGLIYNEITAGEGEQATLDSTVEVHYHGTLPDGTVFDSSVKRGEPIKFPLRNVIKGWQEGVSMMKVGGKATLLCHSDIAYGDQGSPPVIPPGATLVFEVELLQVL